MIKGARSKRNVHPFHSIMMEIMTALSHVDVVNKNSVAFVTATAGPSGKCACHGPKLKRRLIPLDSLDEVWAIDDVHFPMEHGEGTYWKMMLFAQSEEIAWTAAYDTNDVAKERNFRG